LPLDVGKTTIIKLFFQKFGIPVGDIDGIEEWDPFPVAGQAERFLHKWRPFWLERLSREGHSRLLWRPAPLAAITLMTRTDDVFPGRGAALRTGNDVIEIQFLSRQSSATVLARAFVSRVNVISAKANLSFGYPVVAHQQNNTRNPDHMVNQANRFVMD